MTKMRRRLLVCPLCVLGAAFLFHLGWRREEAGGRAVRRPDGSRVRSGSWRNAPLQCPVFRFLGPPHLPASLPPATGQLAFAAPSLLRVVSMQDDTVPHSRDRSTVLERRQRFGPPSRELAGATEAGDPPSHRSRPRCANRVRGPPDLLVIVSIRYEALT